MANAYTSTDAATLGTSLVQTAYDRYCRFQLRAMPIFRNIADTRPVQQAMPGASVVFQFFQDLATATTPLTETVDPDSVAMPQTVSVSVTLNEYGNAVLVTRKLQLVALTDVDAGIGNVVSFNMRDSLDAIVSPVLTGGTNVIRVNAAAIKSNLIVGGAGTTGAVAATDKFVSGISRLAVAKLRGQKVIPRQGELYGCLIHPDVAHDLRSDTGAGGWRTPHEYVAPESLWRARIDEWEGSYYVESPRLPSATDGASSARVYRTLFFGKEALAEAVGEEFHPVFGEVVDKLRRFRPVSWYGMAGWSRFREAALIRAETSSSIASP